MEYNGEYFKLIYSNEESLNNGLYEYRIYPPNCSNLSLLMTQFEISKIDLNEIIPIKTNSKYYIMFDSIFTNMASYKINGEIVTSSNINIQLENENNYLYIISNKSGNQKRRTLIYTATNEESYSTVCNISLNIRGCYDSCKLCSLSQEYTNYINQSCIECNENYYPFLDNGTNCYTKEDVINNHSNWFFDEDKNIFDLCDISCKTCKGSSDENCLSCFNKEDNNPLYLYNGKCIQIAQKGHS